MAFLSALAGGLDIAGKLVNTVAGPVFSALNYKQQKEQFDYMKQMQQQAWLREDNAVQRRVADLKAAGLSPTLAAGSAASSSAPIQVTAPQHQGFEVPNLADAVNTAVGVKQAITQMRKTVAEEQKTNAETVGVNLNNALAKVAVDNAQVKFDLQKAQIAELQKKLGLIDAQTAQAKQDKSFKEIQTKIYNRDYDIFQSSPEVPMQFGTSGALNDIFRFSNLVSTQLENTARSMLQKVAPKETTEGYKRMYGGKR
jgi:hypothetical protein|nr:MAG TPA: minor capsid protein [Microviridae sp.]